MHDLHNLTTRKVFKRLCHDCQTEYETTDCWEERCQACVDRERARQKADLMQMREKHWLAMCPPEFLATDRARLPNVAAFDEALAGKGSVLLFGPTGRGKTRCAWALIEQAVKSGHDVRILDSTAGIRFAAKFVSGPEAAETWLDKLIESDLVVMDDLFKSKLTEAFEVFVYAIIEQRLNHQRRLVVTCNDTGDSLAGRLSIDRSAPLIRRLRESCKAVGF